MKADVGNVITGAGLSSLCDFGVLPSSFVVSNMARILSKGTMGMGIRAFGLSFVLIFSLGNLTGVGVEDASSCDWFMKEGVEGADFEAKRGDRRLRDDVGS